MSKVNIKDNKTFWCFYCKLWTYFTLISSVSIVEFEQVNVCWVRYYTSKEYVKIPS